MSSNQMRRQINIQQYVTDVFHHLGAMVEVPTYALLEVLIPEEYSELFQGEEVLRLAFDPEVAEEEEAPLIIPGSPLLDTINSIALQEEKVLWRHILVDSTSLPDHIHERISQDFTFVKCRLPQIVSHRLEEHHYLVYVFQISLISDERVEIIESIPVDLYFNVPHIEIREHLESAFYQKKKVVLPMAPMTPIHKATESALEKVEEIGREHKSDLEKRLKRFKEEEMEKLQSFYHQTEVEMKEKLEKLDNSEKHMKKRENLLQKIQANDLDRKRRIEDIEEKFSCKIEIRLQALISYSLPKQRIIVQLQQRKETYQLDILYNPLTYLIEDPICKRCKKRIKIIYFKNRESLCSLCERE